MSVNVVIAGASGRMGRALVRELAATRNVTLAGALEARGHPDMGADSGVLAGLGDNGVLLTDDPLPLLAKAQAVIDFTTPASSIALAGLAAQARIVHVIGTTGWSNDENAKIDAAARHAVIVKSGNMSLGVNMLAALVEKAARALPGYDVEILEIHHRMKLDAPSGTALLLGEAAAKGHGASLADKSVRDHHGHRREDGAIGFASLRGGTVIGEHSVMLAGPGERITLSHSAEDRSIFAHGAVTAALWGQGKKPGLYAMTDVLGI